MHKSNHFMRDYAAQEAELDSRVENSITMTDVHK